VPALRRSRKGPAEGNAMEADFPAAHSMDSEWYAVDAHGHVAIFSTGENGHAPTLSTIDESALLTLWEFFHPGEGDEIERVYEDPSAAAREMGVFYYAYGHEFDPIGTYGREDGPATPLHVDQLPPTLRERFLDSIEFHRLNFLDTPVVQPLEWEECVYWYEEDRGAYLADDEKTVRPIPGMEGRFADFCEEFRRENPEEAATFHFEGPRKEDAGEP
jgi:hypothetical protein